MKLFKLIFILFISIIKSQNTQSFRFVVANKDISIGFYQGKSFEFIYSRTLYKNSSFREIGLFDGDKKGTLFKIKKGIWYIKNEKKWEIFYSPYKKVNPNIKIAGLLCQLKIKKQEVLNGIPCNIYQVIYKEEVDDGETEYWFNSIYGIVQIRTGNVTLIREDIFLHKPISVLSNIKDL